MSGYNFEWSGLFGSFRINEEPMWVWRVPVPATDEQQSMSRPKAKDRRYQWRRNKRWDVWR